MTRLLICCLIYVGVFNTVNCQEKYQPSKEFPYGRVNPQAPKSLSDYNDLIGTCNCKSVLRNANGEFKDTVNGTWEFKYIMNGMAVKDETWKENGGHSLSIRQFNEDSLQWYVTYFSANSANPTPSTWQGGKTEDGKIVLKTPQKAPNGMEGFSRLTFFDISENGFKWVGEWVNKSDTFAFPTWSITCKKLSQSK